MLSSQTAFFFLVQRSKKEIQPNMYLFIKNVSKQTSWWPEISQQKLLNQNLEYNLQFVAFKCISRTEFGEQENLNISESLLEGSQHCDGANYFSNFLEKKYFGVKSSCQWSKQVGISHQANGAYSAIKDDLASSCFSLCLPSY